MEPNGSGWYPTPNGHAYPSNGSGNFYSMQPHYANAYYTQGAGYYPQSHSITIPSPGFGRNQPMTSLVPMHMRNRVGPARCGHEGCSFAGTHKEVEIHKMDRHLIFPPGWKKDQEENQRNKRKRGKDKQGGEDEYVDEEAQFRSSVSVSILGTDLKLDSPEAIAAWLEERKKRWPSQKRVAEKAQSRQEALERGQIIAEPQKLRRPNPAPERGRGAISQRGRGRGRGSFSLREGARMGEQSGTGRARGRGNGRGNGRERARGATTVRRANAPLNPSISSGSSTTSGSESSSSSDSDSDSDSGSDVDPVRDAVSSKVTPSEGVCMDVGPAEASMAEPRVDDLKPPFEQSSAQTKTHPNKRRVAQSPKPAYNPFDQRPNLLRNLLMPDIQATVSNLSQAIRFLVANNFLKNVELKPGDSEDVLVQPVATGELSAS